MNFFGNNNTVANGSGNFFSTKKVYGGKWQVTGSRPFDDQEKSLIAKAVVVTSEYGLSCCFFMKSGDLYFQPMAKDCPATAGQELDVDKIQILTLSKTGEKDIERIMG